MPNSSGTISQNVSAFSDESWGGDRRLGWKWLTNRQTFQHSLMNLGVETHVHHAAVLLVHVFQHSLMNLGVETTRSACTTPGRSKFQHSLMNLGVETRTAVSVGQQVAGVSAFSDESWGGDRRFTIPTSRHDIVSAFSDESWGGDLHSSQGINAGRSCFSIL